MLYQGLTKIGSLSFGRGLCRVATIGGNCNCYVLLLAYPDGCLVVRTEHKSKDFSKPTHCQEKVASLVTPSFNSELVSSLSKDLL